MLSHFKSGKPSLAEVVAELAAKDRLTFSQIANSARIHEAFKKSGWPIPMKPHAVRELVMEYYKQVAEDTKKEIQKMLKLKKRFSLTSDEWTALLNKRFMNVNLHCQELTINLGMIPIKGSMPAEIAKELTEKRLQDFGLNVLRDIIASTTDAASVMVKYGKLLDPVLHIKCYNHAYHLAVVAFLYKKEIENVNEDEIEDYVEEDENWDESQEQAEDDSEELNDTIRDLVIKVRKAVKVFRASPVKNDKYLQKHVIADPDIGHRLNLIMDSKTR